MRSRPGAGLDRLDKVLDKVVVWLTGPAAGQSSQAEAALLSGAAELLEVPVATLRLGREPGGRPQLRGAGRPVFVSLSHSGGLAAAALTGIGPIGVDIEEVRALPAAGLARRWLTDADAAWVGAAPADDQVVAFLRLWTQKEAIGKARGVGLRGGGLAQPVPLPPATSFMPVRGAGGLVVTGLPGPDGYVLAVACDLGGRGRVEELDCVVHAATTASIGHTGSTSAASSTPSTENPAPRSNSAR
jgi:4'-phosphopantetheinyl transferase